MKTIKIGGSTYGEVEVGEKMACKGCIFYTVGWNLNAPQCTAVNTPELQCDADNREDGKDVIFKLMANNATEE